ncbi:hypothetical protein L9F63_014084, partial [Diploptera punctata]
VNTRYRQKRNVVDCLNNDLYIKKLISTSTNVKKQSVEYQQKLKLRRIPRKRENPKNTVDHIYSVPRPLPLNIHIGNTVVKTVESASNGNEYQNNFIYDNEHKLFSVCRDEINNY